jgi:hypothetical protein
MDKKDFFSFRWIPSHTQEGDGHDEDLLSADDRHLNEGADALASRGKVLNRPPQHVIEGAKLRLLLTESLQCMLASIHIMRKKLEDARIAALLMSKKVIALADRRPPPILPLEALRLQIPHFCYNPGSPLSGTLCLTLNLSDTTVLWKR